MYCSREYFKTSRLIQQYEKSHIRRISVVKNLTQNSMHGTELILNYIHGVELETKKDKKQDDKKWIFCILSEKEEQYSIETIN